MLKLNKINFHFLIPLITFLLLETILLHEEKLFLTEKIYFNVSLEYEIENSRLFEVYIYLFFIFTFYDSCKTIMNLV